MSTPLLAGTKLGRYIIRSLIGAGGMGEVYLADDTLLRRPIAIKLLIGDYSLNEERLHRFEREAYAASSLNHPNIVTIYEIGSDAEHHFIATEYVDGESLREHAYRKRIEPREIVDIAIQVASALTAAHETGIIHRDIKPENIMLRRDGYVKVLDFGLAKLSEEGWSNDSSAEAATQLMVKTEPGRVMGTIEYMSPEQARGRDVDQRADIFSLGIVLYELVTGSKPFIGETKSDTLAAVLTASVVPMSERRPDVPVELNRIVTKCLLKDRNERYQSARDLLVDLKALRRELDFADKLGLTVSTAGTGTPTSQLQVAATTQSTLSHPSTISELFIQEVKIHPRRSFAFFAVVGLAIVAAGIGVYKLIQSIRRPNAFQNMRVAKLTTSGDVSQPALAVSPDGNYVVYSVNEAGEETLWVLHVPTSRPIAIIPASTVHYTGLTFSPDGSYVYYAVDETRQQSTINQVSVFGGPHRKLINDAMGPVSFSPDGTRFVFRRNSHNSQLITAKADGSDEQVISTRPDRELWLTPVWSPTDKQTIVAGVLSGGGNKSRLTAVSVQDGKEKLLGNDSWLNLTALTWLPDGTGLVFTARDVETKLAQLWSIDYPDGNALRITNDVTSYVGVSITRDGKTLFTIQLSRATNLWVAPNGDADLAKKITFEVGKDEGLSGLAYTPDGKLVYTVRLVADPDLWMSDADGSNSEQLTANAGRNFYPSVTSDGRYIVFISDRNGRNQLWRIDVDGRNPRQLTDVEGIGGRFSVSPTDSSIYYPVVANKISTIWRMSIDGGTPQQITKVNSARPLISPDGKVLECDYGDLGDNGARQIATLTVNGESLKLYDLPNVSKSNLVQWNSDGTALVYRETRDRVDNLWSQKLDGSPATQLTQFKSDKIFSFGWSERRKEFAFARGRDGADVVTYTRFR
jgi:serine/threonine protein kinase/Tol biopolymer transport system component